MHGVVEGDLSLEMLDDPPMWIGQLSDIEIGVCDCEAGCTCDA